MKVIQEKLFLLQDKPYRDFSLKLIPEITEESCIGVRSPLLRKMAKEMEWKDCEEFLTELPHKYHEENILHGFIVGRIKDFKACLCETEKFLPYINNWAVCDSLRPAVFKKHSRELIKSIEKWVKSRHIHTIRFGIGMLMCHFLDENFDKRYLEIPAGVNSGEYYVNMMISWYYATALAKQYEEAVLYLEEKRLSPWIHNKTIQKAVESYRITEEKKKYLKTLKLKQGAEK